MKLVIYAICSGLNRGATLLYFPFLVYFLSIEEFGIWSVSFVTANLMSSVLSLGGSNSVLREGSDLGAEKLAGKLTLNFTVLTSVLSVVAGVLLYLTIGVHWVFLSLLMGFGFSIFDLLASFSRARDRVFIYLVISLVRVIGLFLAIIVSLLLSLSFTELLITQAVSLVLLSFLSLLSLFITGNLELDLKSKIRMDEHLRFSAALIPHSIFQWISSSSDRLVINYMMGAYSAGVYSLLYNVASVLMLANSALSLYIQPHIIRNYHKWSHEGQASRWFSYYSILAVVLYFILILLIVLDSYYLYFFESYDRELVKVFTFIYLGVFFLGGYTFYVPWLFYGRYTKNITLTTTAIALVNVLATVLLVSSLGIIGAAFSTALSYGLYFFLIRFQVHSYFKFINFKVGSPFFLALLLIYVFYFIATELID